MDADDAVDDMEDKAAAKRKKQLDEGAQESEDDIIICPKCSRPVDEADFTSEGLSDFSSSILSKITCPKCGYSGMPVEVSRKEYLKTKKG
ncbi:MAG TPA: hypothetical protein VLD37_03830 [Candidatus Bilamarchaeum sp.]|nr:hypothetical protein [Candidatus Bilamarchaeum sp.]